MTKGANGRTRRPCRTRIGGTSSERSPLLAGGTLAVLAALSFGVTAPIVARAGAGVGPLATAALLYAGASLSALVLGRLTASNGAPLIRAQWLRLFAIALVGAGIAPTLLAWGLRRTGGTAGSLLLNLEAVFTVVLSWLVYREQIGRRVAGALTLMALGGVALTASGVGSTHWSQQRPTVDRLLERGVHCGYEEPDGHGTRKHLGDIGAERSASDDPSDRALGDRIARYRRGDGKPGHAHPELSISG
jgi:EamA-like transporter family